MKEELRDRKETPLTRRDFMGTLAAAGAALGAASVIFGGEAMCVAMVPPVRRCAVVSFHMDQPYLDTPGTAVPYHPPRGTRSGAPVANLSKEAFRRMCCYA